jgi:hypothetical protein
VTLRRAKGAEHPTVAQIELLADCQTLRVGEIRIAGGRSETLELFAGAAALLFAGGEGRVVISDCAHNVQGGSVELVCLGESCTISASRDIHAYVVIAKEQHLAHG